MTFILAGNYKEYHYYIKEHNLPRKEYKYLSRYDQLLGVQHYTILRIGTYLYRSPEFIEAVMIHESIYGDIAGRWEVKTSEEIVQDINNIRNVFGIPDTAVQHKNPLRP